jgi:hypothetical protein
MATRTLPIAGHPDAIVIDTIGKMIENRGMLFAFCATAPRSTARSARPTTRPAHRLSAPRSAMSAARSTVRAVPLVRWPQRRFPRRQGSGKGMLCMLPPSAGCAAPGLRHGPVNRHDHRSATTDGRHGAAAPAATRKTGLTFDAARVDLLPWRFGAVRRDDRHDDVVLRRLARGADHSLAGFERWRGHHHVVAAVLEISIVPFRVPPLPERL